MRTIGLLAAALTLAACGSTSEPVSTSPSTTGVPPTGNNIVATSPPGETADVVRIFDGDSLIAAIDGTEQEVRLIGVNAPEGDECHGDAARATLEQLLDSGELILVSAGEQSDQYGRLLRYLYVDGLNVNLALIANGDVVVLQGDHPLDAEFTRIADSAAASGSGMWASDACGSDNPPTSIEIGGYVYNPSGRDEDNMNGEWVAIANTGSAAVDLSGWTLRDESTQHRYRFPDGFSLDPAQEVLVHTGCGNDTSADLFWCADDPVWSNGGDTVIVQMTDGTVVAHDRFSGEY